MYANIAKRKAVKFQSAREAKYVPLNGAIDIVTQDLNRNPGSASFCLNFEPGIIDGFRRIDGYERLDGRTAPSAGLWYILELTDTSDLEVGDTITGAGGGTGIVILISGNEVAITAWNGTHFIADETTGGLGDVVAEEALNGSLDDYTDIEIELATQNYYRALIEAVPGQGFVLGVYVHLGNIYAFRNNVGETAAILHRATTAGWVVVPFYHMLPFITGSDAFVYGEAITSSGTGVGVVKKVIKLNGDWDTNDAEGYLIVEVTAGSFLNTQTLTGGIDGNAVAGANMEQIVLLPSGKYEFISHNFYAQDATFFIYGCDNKNKAFEIDTNHVYTPIPTLSVPDRPKYICAHKFHLFLAIGASVIGSEPGVPYGYDGANGASELPVGAPITGMKTQPGETMSVATLRNIWGLYGSSVDDFRYELISSDAGAYDYSFVTLGYPFGINDQGVIAQQRVTAYGNFEAATISRLISPLIDQKKLLINAATVLRKRNQIRFYFSDKTCIVICMSQGENGIQARATTLTLAHEVKVICNASDATGQERVLFGAEDGVVYEMEKGFTFDGEPIEYYMKLNHWNPYNDTRREFHTYGVIPQIKAVAQFSLQFAYELSFGNIDRAQPLSREKEIIGGGGYYDQDDFDGLYYDISVVSQVGFPCKGKGTSISVSLYGNDELTKSFTVEGITFDVSPRGFKRAY